MSDTKIDWADKVWNPITGCTPVSPACDHCYAKRMATRLRGRYGYPADDPFRVTFRPDRLDEPLHWRKPQRVFCCSMGDLCHDDVPMGWVDQIFDVMAAAQLHTFLVLTKRPDYLQNFVVTYMEAFGIGDPLPNVWLGVTIERQDFMWRRDLLRLTPAAKRFVSHEPLLGPIEYSDGGLPDWCIVGAETGPGARPMQPAWAHDLYRQCKAAGVPFFFKHGTPGLQYDPEMVATRELPE